MDGDFQFYFTLHVSLAFFLFINFFNLNQSEVCVFHHSNVMALKIGLWHILAYQRPHTVCGEGVVIWSRFGATRHGHLVSELCFIPITTDSYWWELGHATGQWSHTQSKSITESLKKKGMRVLQWSKVHQVHYQSLFSFGLDSLYFCWKQFW